MTRPIPEWKIKRIKKMASEGFRQKDIEEAVKVSHWTVQKYDPRKPGRGYKKHLRDYYD